MILELLLGNGTVGVRLKFAFRGDDLKVTSKWFGGSLLKSAFPWNVDQMKKDKGFYRFNSAHNRQFFMNKNDHFNCSSQGYMIITDQKECSWEKESPYDSAYFWIPNPEKETWSDGAKEAMELRFWGEYNWTSHDRAYRVNC